jgi:hypothetical protein
VTPEEDYRTAPLSDSPDCGCSLCVMAGDGREATRREGSAAGAAAVEGDVLKLLFTRALLCETRAVAVGAALRWLDDGRYATKRHMRGLYHTARAHAARRARSTRRRSRDFLVSSRRGRRGGLFPRYLVHDEFNHQQNQKYSKYANLPQLRA